MATNPPDRPGGFMPPDPGDDGDDDQKHGQDAGTNSPSNQPHDQPEPTQNPFAGTPLEQAFSAFSGGQMPDLSMLMGQMQQMFAPHQGSVNWDLAKQVARAAAATKPDPTPSARDASAVADAVRLAEHWLDEVTELQAAASSSAAWSHAEWIETTMPVWQKLVEPIAAHVVSAMTEAMPAEARTMAGPLIGLLGQAGGAMFGQQVGQAIGELSTEVVASTDVGIPLGPSTMAALLPANVRAFGAGLDQAETDVMLFLALRECAHQRLFAHAPWLRQHLMAAVEEFGRGTTIDISRIESSISSLDPSNPEAIAEAMRGGLFEPERTPAQQAALDRLETALALVEGWVDEVVSQATRERMPAGLALQEAVRRRRATGGPAEQTFASLVGLELRPRRLRDAAALWGALRDRQGSAARDNVWAHPDLMPTAADLDDPIGYAAGERSVADGASGETGSDAEFDAALAQLLDEGSAEAEDRSDSPPESGEQGSDDDEPPSPA